MCVKKLFVREMVIESWKDYDALQPTIRAKEKQYNEKVKEQLARQPESEETIELRETIAEQNLNIQQQERRLKIFEEKMIRKEEKTEWLYQVEFKIEQQIADMQRELVEEDKLIQESE